jgi:hypothetical protein
MGNFTDANIVHYDANIVQSDAKFVQYDANIVQSDAIFVPNETADFADYADFRIKFTTEELTTEAAEDTDFGLLYLIFNFGYYSMGYMLIKQKIKLTTKKLKPQISPIDTDFF